MENGLACSLQVYYTARRESHSIGCHGAGALESVYILWPAPQVAWLKHGNINILPRRSKRPYLSPTRDPSPSDKDSCFYFDFWFPSTLRFIYDAVSTRRLRGLVPIRLCNSTMFLDIKVIIYHQKEKEIEIEWKRRDREKWEREIYIRRMTEITGQSFSLTRSAPFSYSFSFRLGDSGLIS